MLLVTRTNAKRELEANARSGNAVSRHGLVTVTWRGQGNSNSTESLTTQTPLDPSPLTSRSTEQLEVKRTGAVEGAPRGRTTLVGRTAFPFERSRSKVTAEDMTLSRTRRRVDGMEGWLSAGYRQLGELRAAGEVVDQSLYALGVNYDDQWNSEDGDGDFGAAIRLTYRTE